MRILFVARRFSYLKNFEGPILELAKRGHAVHLVALAGEGKLAGTAMIEAWVANHAGITYERLPPPAPQASKIGLRARVSMMVDYARYLEPAYGDAEGLVERARRRTPVGFVRLLASPAGRLRPVSRVVTWILRRLEAATPRRPELDAFLRAQAPDLVLFTPLIALQSEEQDLLTAAVEQGLRTVFCVLSWDNLSSKAIIRTMPALVTVWNDVQRDEARRLHGVPDDRIVVTGAQTFDHWFNRAPSRPRGEFLERVGLPVDRPFLLWVCSALFRTSPVEAKFVRRWIEALRASADPLLREVSILVRPHPTRLLEWDKVPLDDLGPVSLWGANPVDPAARNDYFESLFYSAAVVGLNTSAFLEAAIVGRPVYTVLLPEYHDSQEGTLHFPYLLRVAGGLLHTSRDLTAHLAELGAALRQPEATSERSRRFVEAFIRPRGLDTDATGIFVAALDNLLARSPAPPQRSRPAGVVFQRLYDWLERRHQEGAVKEWLTTPNEINHQLVTAAKLAKGQAREARRAARLAEAQQRRERRELQERERAARLDTHQDTEARLSEAAILERRRLKDEAMQRHRAARAQARREARQQARAAAIAERQRLKEEALQRHRSTRVQARQQAGQQAEAAAMAERRRLKEEALRRHRADKRSRDTRDSPQ